MPVEDQVIQIYAATQGHLDRINVDRIPEYLEALTQRAHSELSDVLESIGGGDWEDSTVDKVDRFLADLTDSVRSSESGLLEKIAGGDWSEETQQAVEKAVSSFAEDFGFDLDEEGHPLEEGDEGSSRDSQRERRDEDRSDEEDQAQAA